MKWIDIPPVWLLGCLAIAALEARLSPLVGPSAIGLIGAVLFWGGIALILGAIVQMYLARTTPIPHQEPDALVSSGLFGVTRNPIYLGDLLVLCGLCLRWDAFASLLLVPALLMILTRRFILAEEARLEAAFGDAFTAYCARTRRWM